MRPSVQPGSCLYGMEASAEEERCAFRDFTRNLWSCYCILRSSSLGQEGLRLDPVPLLNMSRLGLLTRRQGLCVPQGVQADGEGDEQQLM